MNINKNNIFNVKNKSYDKVNYNYNKYSNSNNYSLYKVELEDKDNTIINTTKTSSVTKNYSKGLNDIKQQILQYKASKDISIIKNEYLIDFYNCIKSNFYSELTEKIINLQSEIIELNKKNITNEALTNLKTTADNEDLYFINESTPIYNFNSNNNNLNNDNNDVVNRLIENYDSVLLKNNKLSTDDIITLFNVSFKDSHTKDYLIKIMLNSSSKNIFESYFEKNCSRDFSKSKSNFENNYNITFQNSKFDNKCENYLIDF